MLRLKVNGRVFSGWTGVAITRGIKQLSSTFNLELTDKWDGAPWNVKPFDLCELFDGDALIITGYIDSANVSYASGSHNISITGRSKTADLVDCSAPSTQFRGQTFEQIAKALAAPFGVDVVVETDTGAVIRTWKPDEGVTVFEALEALARLRGLFLTDNAQGALVITRAGKDKTSTDLVSGENIKSASSAFDVRDRFSHYLVKGQQKGSDTIDAETAAHAAGSVTDKGVTRYRPMMLMAEEQADLDTAKKRAQWEANIRFGNSQSFSVTVQGWRHSAGVWQANKRVRLNDAYLGVDAEFIIASVQMSLSNDTGTETTLELVRAESLTAEPISVKPAKAKTTKPSGGQTPNVRWEELDHVEIN